MAKCPYSRLFAGVLAFSLFAGVVSGFLTAATFMPMYSVHYNVRQWHPGSTQLPVMGQVPGFAGSRVIYTPDTDVLDEMGLPLDRLWLYDPRTAAQPRYALIAHGIWRQNPVPLGGSVTVEIAGSEADVPVAGVWNPFHPQLGESWVVLVGEGAVPALADAVNETLPPPTKPPFLPPAFQGWNLVIWLCSTSLVFSLYGAIGFIGKRGREAAMTWGKKLWCGGGVASFAGLLTAVFVFRLSLPLPLLDLLPMTVALLAASYLLALLLLSGLAIVLAR